MILNLSDLQNICREAGKKHRRRRAFTLVEMMVSMALIVFIMSILSAAFATASKTFRDLKAAGDLADQLRGALIFMRQDLAAPHFDPVNKKLSDTGFWSNGPPQGGFIRILQGTEPTAPWAAVTPSPLPQKTLGAIQLPSGVAPTFTFPSLIPTYVAQQSLLHFTVSLPGMWPSDFFSTDLGAANAGSPVFDITGQFSTQVDQDRRYQNPVTAPNTVFKSQFAEVVWLLTPQPVNNAAPQDMTTTDDVVNKPPQPLFQLMRRQLLLWPERTKPLISIPNPSGFSEVSIPQFIQPPVIPPGSTVQINRMVEVTQPPLRFAAQNITFPLTGAAVTDATCASATLPGAYPVRVDDIVVSNVLSFGVRILLDGASDFVDLSDQSVQAFTSQNPAFPSATGPWVFDTWSQQNLGKYDYSGTNWQPAATPTNLTIPLFKNGSKTIRIRAIQITLRIWDPKSQITRQSSMVQDM